MHVRAGLVRLARHESMRSRFLGRQVLKYRFFRPGLTVAAVAVLATAGLAAPAAQPAAAATRTDAVTVNATSGLGTIPPDAIGLNTAVYDGDMNDAADPGAAQGGGHRRDALPGRLVLRHLQLADQHRRGRRLRRPEHRLRQLHDHRQGGRRRSRSSPSTTAPAPPPSRPPGCRARRRASDGVKYWEVGNEVYGNGTYGANWETDSHCDTSPERQPGHRSAASRPRPTTAAQPSTPRTSLAYISAMHAADANAKVCAILTTPGFWPDGVTNSEYPQSLEPDRADRARRRSTQCVIVHYYPGGSTTAGMLTDPPDIAGIVSTLHSEISQYAGIANPASIPILVTETNSTLDLDTQPGALFAADMYMTWLENGVTNVDWWNEHNGEGTVSTVNGATDYGDQGIFSNNTNYGGTTEPAVDTPFAPYYGIEMLSKLGRSGRPRWSPRPRSNALLRVHAVRDAAATSTC